MGDARQVVPLSASLDETAAPLLAVSATRVKPYAACASSKPAMPPSSLDPSDDHLVACAQRGDEAAFAALVLRHYAAAFAVARRILRDTGAAEETAQDAFVRAWRALARFRGDARFGTWLHRIVARCALDHVRARARRPVEVAADLAHVAAPTAHDEPEVDMLLAGLTDAQRSVVVLYYFGDRSVRDIAIALDLPENTVKTHLHRARASMRQTWLDEHAVEVTRA